jgi:hypothetical protein
MLKRLTELDGLKHICSHSIGFENEYAIGNSLLIFSRAEIEHYLKTMLHEPQTKANEAKPVASRGR